MPNVFQSFDEAHSYWSLVARQMVQYLPLLTITVAQLALPRATSDSEVRIKLAGVRQNPKISKFISESRYWLRRWIEAYEPYYQAISRQAQQDPRPYLQAINLRVEYLIVDIYIATPRFRDLVTARGLTHRYREVNELVAILLASRPNCGFAMDSGWAWPLFVTSFACRDADVRNEAIFILGRYPMRNALRCSQVLRAMALKNQKIEAANAGFGDEDEQWLRLRRREVLFENLGGSAVFRYMEKDAISGNWSLVEEIASLQVREDGRLNWRRQPKTKSVSTLASIC